jgi:predicted AAA+ superfamily ATPase
MRPNSELFGCTGFSENSGRLMENIVLLELKRARNEDSAPEIYYHKNRAEVDFLLKEKLGIEKLVQVCYDIEDPDVEKGDLKTPFPFSQRSYIFLNQLLSIWQQK